MSMRESKNALQYTIDGLWFSLAFTVPLFLSIFAFGMLYAKGYDHSVGLITIDLVDVVTLTSLYAAMILTPYILCSVTLFAIQVYEFMQDLKNERADYDEMEMEMVEQ